MNWTLPESNSHIHAKSLIGRVQQSVTCTLIQDTVAHDVSPKVFLNMTTMGVSMLRDAFKDASMYFTHTNGYFGEKKIQKASSALAFIQGTSLDIVIKTFGLDYDPEQLRITFFRKFNVK